MQKRTQTSWEEEAGWYDGYLRNKDTYQEMVILPNLLRMLGVQKGERVLDLGCGQGYFAKHFAEKGAKVAGIDAAPALIELARKNVPQADFRTGDAAKLPFENNLFDAVFSVLALQNIGHLLPALKEARRVLKKGGRFIFVINHPAFRIPQNSGWGWDEAKKIQYRRVDRYLTPAKIKIAMHPGRDASYTWSFHRSLQDFVKALHGAGFSVSRMEEWISHRASKPGPRADAEDRARREIPLFLTVEAV